MMPKVHLSDAVYQRLENYAKRYARPFVSPNRIVEMLLDAHESAPPSPAYPTATPPPNHGTRASLLQHRDSQCAERSWEVQSGDVTIPCCSRLDSKSDEGRLAEATVFGFCRSHVVRALGKAGYKAERARRLFDALGLQAVRTSSIRTWISECHEGAAAEFTAEQLAAFDRLAPADA